MSASFPPNADDVRVRTSDRPPPAPSAPAEHDFVAGLRSVGLLAELDENEHARISHLLESDGATESRRVDLLVTYFGAAGNAESRVRRETRDRFFWHTEESPTTIRTLVQRLAVLSPELGAVDAVWAGARATPVLRLRAKGHFVDVPEEPEEHAADPLSPSITVRAVVRAANALLALCGAEHRFVPLACDGDRETYVGVTRDIASMLCAAELVDEFDENELLALGGWPT